MIYRHGFKKKTVSALIMRPLTFTDQRKMNVRIKIHLDYLILTIDHSTIEENDTLYADGNGEAR